VLSFRSLLKPGAIVFAVAVAISFAALAYRLGDWDVENDEAIYTYAVERMLDTGDWMTPRTIPSDFAFLEKPPLKFWLVAAPIKLGLLPRTQFGLRAVDALLGAIAFGYVALLGYRLSGVTGAVTSCLILFGMRPLVLAHGLRNNEMEAPLVAAYCGGMYHFLAWRHAGRRQDALITGAWFTLAFLTKFVAAAFLPMVGLVSLALPRPGLLPKPWRAALADWVWAGAICLGVSAPWFVYEYILFGNKLLETMFLQHVFVRFTGALDPTHLKPWHFYVFEVHRMLDETRCEWLVAAGAGLLLYRVATRRDGLAWTLLVWGVLPIALVSALSSKVTHYIYPFLPPFALAGGLALSAPVGLLRAPLERLADRLERARLLGLPALLARPGVRRTLVTVGIACVALATATLILGTARIDVGLFYFRNSSIVRPLAVAGVCFALSRAWRHALTLAPVALLSVLPLWAARETLVWASYPAESLRALRDCIAPEVAAGRARPGAYAVDADPLPHPYSYYFLQLGAWDVIEADHPALQPLALSAPSGHRPLVVSDGVFGQIALRYLQENRRVPPAASAQSGIVIVLPGPLGACLDDAVHAGARSRGGTYEAGP
jgi:4-amino-4-deoxy-L-arabinose transferase-like glycosyltransferase